MKKYILAIILLTTFESFVRDSENTKIGDISINQNKTFIDSFDNTTKWTCELQFIGDEKSSFEVNYGPNNPWLFTTKNDFKEFEILSDNIFIIDQIDTSFYYSINDTMYLMKSMIDIARHSSNDNYYDKDWVTIDGDKLYYFSQYSNIKYGFSILKNLDLGKRVDDMISSSWPIHFSYTFFDFEWDQLAVISSISEQIALDKKFNFTTKCQIDYSKSTLFYFINKEKVVRYGVVNNIVDFSYFKKAEFYLFQKEWTHFLSKKENGKLIIVSNG